MDHDEITFTVIGSLVYTLKHAATPPISDDYHDNHLSGKSMTLPALIYGLDQCPDPARLNPIMGEEKPARDAIQCLRA